MPSRWAACGLPIGAGQPDLVLVDFRSELHGLGQLSIQHIRLLANLAEMGPREVPDIADSSGLMLETVEASLNDLAKVGALVEDQHARALCPAWLDILTDTIAIEAKVADWRRGAAQAARNRIFASRSFIAVPPRIAARISDDPIIDQYGIGVLAVEPHGCVTLVREAPRQRPLIWYYYFSLAMAVAASLRKKPLGVRRSDRGGERTLS